MKAYQVTNWDENYEVSQGRKCSTMKWVAIPNSHSGHGFSVIAGHDRAEDLFSAWILIIQVASKMPKRGLLVSDSGKAVTSKNMAFRTHFKAENFELAFEVLSGDDIGWIERVEV